MSSVNSQIDWWLSLCEVGSQIKVAIRARNIKENIRYMRINKRLKRAGTRKSAIAPAEWQEFIEI